MQLSRRNALKAIGCTALPGVLAGRSRARSTDRAAWPMDAHDAGASRANLESPVEEISRGPANLIVAAGTRFFRGQRGNTTPLVASGDANWETDRSVLGTPVYEQGVVYAVVEDDGRALFVAFDAETGAVLWNLPLVDSTPTGGDGTGGRLGTWQSPLRLCGSFVYGFSGDRLYCVDLDERQVRWEVRGRFVDFAVEPGTVVTAGDGIRAFDDRSGDEKWTVENVGLGHVAVEAGSVIQTNTAIRVFDAEDGTKQWERQAAENDSSSNDQLTPDYMTEPAVRDETVYVAVNVSAFDTFMARYSGDVRGYELSTGDYRGSVRPPTFAEFEPGSGPPPEGPEDDDGFGWWMIQSQQWSPPVVASDGLYVGYSDSLQVFGLEGGGGHYSAFADGLARVTINDSGSLGRAERLTQWYGDDDFVVADGVLYQ